MSSKVRTSRFDLSLYALRRDHPGEYRFWVQVGLVTSLIGYSVSSLLLAAQHGVSFVATVADPYAVVADLVALGLVARGRVHIGAYTAVLAPLVDVHFSLLTLAGPTVLSTGLVAPVFVLASGLLFGGRVAFGAAALLSLSIPTTLWLGGVLRVGIGISDPHVLHFVVVLEAVLLATTALLAAFLRSFSRILLQHQDSEARSRELAMQLQHAQKLEALGLLAGGIAHDFNNLLMAIGSYGSLLARSSDPLARQFGAEIVATQKRGATLTRQLLAFARKDISQPKPMDLARTVREMASLLERALGDSVQLHLECERPCAIVADPGRIEQVVLNLALNARDAMPSGGPVRIRCIPGDSQVRLSVEDEGVGMDEATKARVFEPFFTTKGRNQGTGLGLSTVHGIVAESGGSIEIDSLLGRGSCFTVSWPRAALVHEDNAERAASLDGQQRIVWLVEDNTGARVFVERLLTDLDFRVVAAATAEELLDLTATADVPPALLLSDVILPGLSGPQLAEQLRSRWPQLPCLFMSGYVGDAGLASGFDPVVDLVPKPFTATDLLERIGRKLGAEA